MNKEPSLEEIEDYDNKESPQKRKIVKLVVLFCLAVGIVYAIVQYNSMPAGYIGTQDNPGINIPNN